MADTAPTVMVVDDHPIWRDAVARDLAEGGFNVVATADGVAAARRRAAAVKPDVVLMDMRLGDGDGAQATAEVLAASPSSKVLVLSAYVPQASSRQPSGVDTLRHRTRSGHRSLIGREDGVRR